MNAGHVIEAEILKAGTHNASSGPATFTVADLDALARNTTSLLESTKGAWSTPLVIGHDGFDVRDGQPAVGYVTKLWRQGASLFARFEHVPSIIANAVKKKLYRTVSIEAYPKFEHTTHAKTLARPDIRGGVISRVSLLGASIPAVRGMADLQALLAAEGIEAVAAFGAPDDDDDVLCVTMAAPAAMKGDRMDLSNPKEFRQALVSTARDWGFDLSTPDGLYRARAQMLTDYADGVPDYDRSKYLHPSASTVRATAAPEVQTFAEALEVIAAERGLSLESYDGRVAAARMAMDDPRFTALVPDYRVTR